MTTTPETPPSKSESKVVTVRAFGARLMGGKDAEECASGIFRAQNQLWNKLVEIEHAARATYRDALLQSDTELAGLQVQADEQQLLIDALYEARNKDRSKARSKKTEEGPGFTGLIKDAQAKLKGLRAGMKEIKGRAKEAAKPLIEAAEAKRREDVKAAVHASNLWWAHSETILAKFDVARVRAMKEGRELRFHRFDGNGSMGVRFSVEGGSLEKIYAGKTSLLKFRDPTPQELGRMTAVKGDGGVRKIIELRAGDKREDKSLPQLTFLVTMHGGRDFPTDAPLKTVSATRTIHINKGEWKLVFTFSRASTGNEVQPVLPAKAVGIDFGFRVVKDESTGEKGLRVGTLHFGDRVQYVTLGQDWLSRMERADRIRSQLHDTSNEFLTQLRPWISDENLAGLDDDDWFKVLCGKVRRSKEAYASLLISLCDAHRKAENPLGEAVGEMMAIYRKEVISLSLEAHHCRRKAVDNRKQVYRNVAARLVREAGLIAIVDTDFRAIAATVNNGEDTELVLTARRNRTWASPSELRLAIEQTAKREKAELVAVPAANNTRTCSACGHVHGTITDLTFVCQGCAKVWDQDVNASANARNFGMDNAKSGAVTMG